MIPRPANPIVASLDVSDLAEAERLARLLAPNVGMLKVGSELFWAHGLAAVRQTATHAPVFVDAKLHDIPNTVERASANIAAMGVRMFIVHALGGAAKRGADAAGVPMPLVIAVTVLSSQSGEGLASPASLAWEAKQAGLDGVVVSGEDVRDVREACGDAFCLAVPGIRLPGANGDDQVRVLTPRAAIERGADYLLIGRPIIEADDPVGVVRGILHDVG